MKNMRFEYQMNMETSEVEQHYVTLKCIPHSTCRQRIKKLQITAEPLSYQSRAEDAFGNILMIGHERTPHDHFNVSVIGEAEVEDLCYEEEEEEYWRIYAYPSVFTKMGAALGKAYREWIEVRRNTADCNLDIAWTLMEYLRHHFSYESGVTQVQTTAEEAMRLRKGVCQDYAHCFLALIRHERIPARYVVGMMSGEGFSHAWIEVWDNGRWYGFDPTNNQIVTEGYIKISHGRDYADCVVNKGIFMGNGTQKHNVWVSVKEH